jgi:hypothetical protein
MIRLGGLAMPWKTDVLFLACCAAWLVCLPVLMVIGAMGLIFYAAFCLLTDCFSSAAPELSNAREIAQHLCFGNDVRHVS